MKAILRLLSCYILYTLVGIIVTGGLFIFYQYSIAHAWGIQTGFFFSTCIDALYIFFPLVSIVAFLRTMFLIRKIEFLFGLNLLFLALLNLVTLFSSYLVLNTLASVTDSPVLPSGYLLNISDNSLFIQGDDENALVFILNGQTGQSPYFSVHTDGEFDQENQQITTPSGINIPMTRDVNPYYYVTNSFDIFNIDVYTTLLVAFTNKSKENIWQWLFFVASISFILSSLWCTVQSNPAYGMHIWLTIAGAAGMFFAYSVFIAFYTARSNLAENLGSLFEFMYNNNAVFLIPGGLLYIIYFVRLLSRRTQYE